MKFAESAKAYAAKTGEFAGKVITYVTSVGEIKKNADTLNSLVNPSSTGGSADGTSQIESGLAEAQSAAASVGAVSGTSAADQLNAAAGTVSAAAGTGDALQGDAGTISAGLDSASSAIDILSGIDTSSMDEATAAAVTVRYRRDRSNFRWCCNGTGRCRKPAGTCRPGVRTE